ncbi:AbgT family transporter [Nonomuraea sp. NPDC000554]|uniref:AbgT family transporter n=1 Tax=Nonomuraea sp. NPDC000554 TaxID=3154259 RepID=UPI003318F7CE
MSTVTVKKESRSLNVTMRVLNGIERAGNKLPHPFWLFIILSVALMVLSWILASAGVSAVNPADGKAVVAKNLLSAEGVTLMLGKAIESFTTFPPLGTVLVVMLGVAVADRAGLLSAVLRRGVSRVPARWVTFVLAFTGMISHVAADSAYIVLIPLGGLAFYAVGRSPIVGVVVAFVSVAAGFDASPVVTPLDVILGGITTEAAHTIDPSYTVTPLANYFFSVGSSVVLAAVITLVTETVLTKRAKSMPIDEDAEVGDLGELTLSAQERRGLRWSGVTLLVIAALVALAIIPDSSPLRGEGGSLVTGPLLAAISILLGLAFAIIGIVYGRIVGTIKSSSDVPEFMAHGMREMAPVIVLFFAISQFLAYFKWTGIGTIVAIQGAAVLKSAGVSGPVVFLGILIIVTLINLLITSGSAQWALVGPVFVPMLMLLKISPEATQALYRIADSCTNAITPMSPYFVLVLGFIQRYRKSAGIGTLMSLTLPLSLAMLVVWTLFFLAWWALGIPLGPGAPVR